MFSGFAQRAWPLLAALLLAGCTAMRLYPALELPPEARLVEQPEHTTACRFPAEEAGDVRQVAYRPRQVLVLSGGAEDGAYTVGVLKGWTASSRRPTFDVVTGISTGALIAPFAFLGAEYDAALEQSYTQIRASDIYDYRPLPALLFADSLADSTPLRRRIAAAVTPEVLAQVARAHAQGRRLYVGTTNLDTKQLVVWDLGAIASGTDPHRLELFRHVLLASASFPGVLPPVAIDVEVDCRRYTELHVDGGVAASLFLQPGMLGVGKDRARADTDVTVTVIVAGKLRPLPRAVQRRLFQVTEESLGGVLQSRFEGDLLKTYLVSHFAGARFALAAVPEDFPEPANNLSFDPRAMRALFDLGYRSALQGNWLSQPPGLAPGYHLPPRRGVQFTIATPSAQPATLGSPTTFDNYNSLSHRPATPLSQ
jgi:predicted acylesterase/phospholipase RssA